MLLESELARLGILAKHSMPYHPQTCGNVERFHQTRKRVLDNQTPASARAGLQAQLDKSAEKGVVFHDILDGCLKT